MTGCLGGVRNCSACIFLVVADGFCGTGGIGLE